jgi:hypothetical protein
MIPGLGDPGMHPVFWKNGILEQLPGMRNVEVIDVNRFGQVVGVHMADFYPALWSAAGVVIDIASPGDPQTTRPVGINNRGEVAATIPMRLTPETMFDPSLRAGIFNTVDLHWRLLGWPDRQPEVQGVNCEAAAINEVGWVAGSCRALPGDVPSNPWHPFIWKTSEPTGIPIPDRFWEARVVAMNRAGALAATTIDLQGVSGAAFWSSQTGWIRIPIPPSFNMAEPRALNDYGELLLNFRNGWLSVPAVWSRSNGLMLLGTGTSADRGAGVEINNEGVVVGCVGAPWDLTWQWQFSGRPATWQLPR